MKKTFNKILPLLYGTYFNGLSVISRERAAEKAFTLFCTPRKGKILPHQKAYLNGAKDEVLHVAEMDLQTYQWPGPKETVVLLHGWESNAFRWRNLIGHLQQEGFHVVALDAPGHGYSTGNLLNMPIYLQCVAAMVEVYKPKYIIGHSFGGMAALYHQYVHPGTDVERIVTLGAPSDFTEIMADYQNLLRFNDTVLEGLVDYFSNKYNVNIPDLSSAKFVQNIAIEGLLVHDIKDTVVPFGSSEIVHANWSNSRLLSTNGLGHSLHQEEVNREIIRFLIR